MPEKEPKRESLPLHDRVGIIGAGHVGKGISKIFPQAKMFDPFISDYSETRDEINKCDLAIICVPTPEDRVNNKLDCSIVEEVISWVESPLVLIKSTVEIGFTDRMKEKYGKRVCMSPEYYGESRYYQPTEWFDPIEWPYLIVGGDPKDVEEVMDFFVPRLGPLKQYMACTAKEAEATKLMENIFFATKVTFCNEMALICEANEISYGNVRELWALDPRLSRMHSSVFKGDRGFAGKCFPKDLAGLIGSAIQAGYNPEFLLSVQKNNERFRKMNK
jgi:nucleotide sugar dehydrogenase